MIDIFLNFLSVLHLDSPRNRLYFDNDDKIESVSLDGSDRRILVGPGALTENGKRLERHSLMGMTVDSDNQKVFFGSQIGYNSVIKGQGQNLFCLLVF